MVTGRSTVIDIAGALACLLLLLVAPPGRAVTPIAATRLPDSVVTPYHVGVEMKDRLQVLLDAHKSIILDADRDYRVPSLATLKVGSGMQIVGGWNTRVPPIVIVDGARNVRVMSVRSDAALGADVIFAAGDEASDIEITGGAGGIGTAVHIKVEEGARLNRVRIMQFGGLEVDQGHAGYVRNSVFAGLLGYWPGPHVRWRGNRGEPSGPNLFLGFSSVTPQKGSSWHDAGDLWLANIDCESWNMHDHDQSECFQATGRGRVVVLGLSGGTSFPQMAGALARFDDNDALVAWFLHGTGGTREAADVHLENVGSAAVIEASAATRVADEHSKDSPTQLHFFDAGGAHGNGELPDERLVALMRETPPSAGRGRPVRRQIDETRARADGGAAEPDASVELQRRIDRDGVVRLAAGVYYLDRPLRLGSATRTEGLLGDDANAVVLVARGKFPVIAGRGDLQKPRGAEAYLIYLALDRLTLVGGTFGLDWTGAPGNLGPGATVAFSSFSNLTLMHQEVAGVNVEGIHGIDANTWRHVDFVDMPSAIRGRGHGSADGMTYADKQSFVDCQFQHISGAAWDWMSDRPSGGELWLDNYFFDVGEVSRTRAATSLLWANDVMESVTGDVGLKVTDDGATATYYFLQYDNLWTGKGPAVVTDSQSFELGTLFVRTRFEEVGGSLVASAGRQTLFAWDSALGGSATLGAVKTGVFINSHLGPIDQPIEVIENGVARMLVRAPPEAPAPHP